MTKTSQGRFQAAMTAYYPLFAMSKANLVSLGVFGNVFFEPQGCPLWAQMRYVVHPETDKEG